MSGWIDDENDDGGDEEEEEGAKERKKKDRKTERQKADEHVRGVTILESAPCG
jgi:hypothetical protein